MKDFFNARQRFSIRKFSFGAASVLLGTVFLAQVPVAHADGTTETESTSNSTASDEDSSATSATAPTVPSTPDTTSSTGTVTVTETEASSATADTTSETPAEKTTETASTATDKSKLASQIAALEAAINKAPAGTDTAALTQAKVALAQAKSIQASTSASQADVDAQTASLADMVTVVAEAASQANQAETESKEVAAEAAQPAEKTELEKTVSEAQVTNKLATDFVEKEAPTKEVTVDLTDAVKSAVADNQAHITAAQAVLADEKATTEAYQTAMAQLKSSIEAVYVSLRKAGKEEFSVSLAETTGSADSESSDKALLQLTVETLEKLLNSGNLEAVSESLKTEAQTEVAKGKAMLTDTTSTTEEVAAMDKKLKDLGHKITLQIPLSDKSKEAIDKLEIGKGVGVLVDETETATPGMTDPNGASLREQDIPKYEGVQLQPTSNSAYSTFAYGGLYYLKFAGIDYTDPKLASTYYVRGSRSTDTTNNSILVEVVKIKDNTVVETHTLNPGESATSKTLAIDTRVSDYYKMKDQYIHFSYDNSTASDTTLGKLGYYLSEPQSAWAMGTYEIPKEAKYITKYMTTDGKELATYTMKGWSNQLSTPSEKREFSEYKYIETLVKGTPEFNIDEIDSVERLAQQYNAKLLKRVVKPDGTVIKTLYIKDPTLTNDQAAPAAGSDTKGYIKVFETNEIAPGQTNTNLKFFYGDDTLMSNGKPLITEEAAKEIEEVAKNTPQDPTKNTVRIYTDDASKSEDTQKSIDIGFVGYNDAARPYGIVEPGKTLYIRNRNVTYVNDKGETVSGPNNFQLIPLYNDLIYVPEVVHLYEPSVSVKVKYVDKDGNEITGTGKDYPSGGDKKITEGGVTVIEKDPVIEVNKKTPEYDTAPERPNKIVGTDGTVYYYVGLGKDSAPEKDNLKKGNYVVSYTYEKAGSVVVKYETTDGTKLEGELTFDDATTTTNVPTTGLPDETDAKPGTDYNTTDHKPAKITANGTVYYLVSKAVDGKYSANGVKEGSDAETGKVEAGKTKEVTYIYEKAGNVNINYITTDGTVIKTPVKDVENGKPGDAYNAAETTTANTGEKPATITVGDKVYKLVTEAGTTTGGDTKLTYDANGVVTATADGGNTINNNPIGGQTGEVAAGQTTEVTYVYQEVKGDVTVKYIDEQGNELSGTATMPDGKEEPVTTDGIKVADQESLDQDYDTTTKKATRIVTADGKVYELAGDVNNDKVVAKDSVKDDSAAETGKVKEDPQNVTYVYKEVKGNVVVKYKTTDGTQLSGDLTLDGTDTTVATTGVPVTIDGATEASNGADYNTANYKPTTITTKDGKKYELVTVAGKTTDGTTYGDDAVATGEGNASASGKVVAGETQTVTYIYQEVKGNVVVKYETTDGTQLSGDLKLNGSDTATTVDAAGVKVTGATDASGGTAYDTTSATYKPTTITTAQGKVYKLVAKAEAGKYSANGLKEGSAPESGDDAKVIAGETQTVTYVYEEVKGDVTVHYVDAAGNPISGTTTGIDKKTVGTSEVDESNASIGKAYDTTDLRPTTITVKNEDGTETVYYYKQVQDGSATETGKVAETPTNVTYVYEKAGSVVVKYVTTDGTKLEGNLTFDDATTTTNVPTTGLADETNAEPGKDYNTTDHKPATITTADGKTYALVAENNGVKSDSAPETGEVKAGETTTVTYVYQEVKGSVKVEYYDEDGNKITTDKPVVTESSTGVDYDATTSEYRPETITTANGDVYYYKEVKSDSEPTSGKVTEGETVVKYVYEKAGSVTINYISTDGTVIKQPVKDVENVKPGTAYDTTESSDSKEERPTVISTGGKVYRLVQTAGKTTTGVSYDENGVATGEGHYPTTGTVAAGLDKNVTYVYQEVQFGDVEVAYINTNGEKIADTESVESGTEVGTKYTTTPKAIITVTNPDGTTTTYRLVTTEGTTTTGVTYDANGVATGEGHAPATGEVTATKQTVTYVYEAVKGNVVVNYIDENGKPISGTTTGIAKTSVSTSEPDTTGANVGTHYDTADLRPETITTAEGKVYKLLPALTKGNETGQVTEGTTTVTYVYQLQKGDVDVHYVNTDGKVIAPTVKDTDDADTGSDYDTTDHKPAKIVEDSTGDVYYYKEIKSGDKETGKVTAGTTDVTYVYEKAGNVVVNYVTTDGTVIKEQVKDETNAKPGSGYNTTDNKPATITKDGKTYQLVAKNNGLQDGSAPESGKVEAGKTTEITYVYEEVKTPEVKQGNVVVENYDTKGNKLGETTEVVKPSPEGTEYTTKPADKIESNGKTYYYKEVKSDSEPTSGKVKEGTTTVKYVYEEAGNVVVNYVTTDGTVIKEQVKDETNAKPGSGYDTTDNKPATITKDGKTYQLVPTATKGNETGEVVSGQTLEVTYVYQEVKTPEVQRGNVVIRYENEKGEIIQNPVDDETNVPVGTSYDTRDHKPTTIVKNGKIYELVPSLTRGAETGTVEAGTTVITYVYREVATPTPTEEKVTKFIEEGTNTVLSPEEKGNQPKKDITGYEFVKTTTDESGNTIHVYRKVVTPTPTEEKVTKFVEEGTNTVLSPDEKGNQPKKDIPGYEFVRTETDANGNTVHIYRKVVTPTPQPTPNPQPTPQPEPTPVPQPEPQPKPTPTNVTPAHDAPVQPAAVVTPAQTSAPASASEKQLPNTGTENHAGLAALGLAGLLGGLGLVSRKKKED